MPAKKTTILTADDDPQLLRLIARNLQFEGYDVLTASDGSLSSGDSAPFTVGKGSQSITFAAIPDHTYGDADFDPAATASSGLTVSYSVGASDNWPLGQSCLEPC